jgi:signal transduction histidine kinase
VSSAASADRCFAARQGPGALIGVALAIVALVGSFAQLSHGGIAGTQTGPGELDWIGGVLAAFSALPLIAWRYAPRAVFGFTGLVTVVMAGLGYPLALAVAPAFALYLLAASRDDREPWTRRDSGMVVALFAAYLGAAAVGDGGFPGSELLHTGLAWAVAWFAGERTRLRREHVHELHERAVRAERETEREGRLAVAEERARIARDLHDAAGHAINVIAVRAGTARMRRDPERSQKALEEIEELARKTVDEIDQIVGSLRESGGEEGSADAPPGLASLDTLVARAGAAGLDVKVASAGDPRHLEGPVDQAAYRILQEALTNAARHGTGPARVELAFGQTALGMTITNPTTGGGAPRSNGGHGLIGMRERATLLGGRLDVERANGSFRLRVRLPYEGRAA